jgi:hypothetical protein
MPKISLSKALVQTIELDRLVLGSKFYKDDKKYTLKAKDENVSLCFCFDLNSYQVISLKDLVAVDKTPATFEELSVGDIYTYPNANSGGIEFLKISPNQALNLYSRLIENLCNSLNRSVRYVGTLHGESA